MGGFPATILNQSSDPQLKPPRDAQDGVAFKFGGPDHLDPSLQAAKEPDAADSKEEMKEGELLAGSREQSIANPTSCDAAQLQGAFSRHTAANEERIEERSSRLTKRSGLSSSIENQRDELMGNLLVSS